jgi:hypothetical protein
VDVIASRLRANNITKFQTIQRLSDSWRNAIGYAAVAAVLAYCDSDEDLATSDEERIQFATSQLKDLRFMYQDTEGKTKDVCQAHYCWRTHLIMHRESFVAPLFLRPLPRISLRLKALCEFIIFMTMALPRMHLAQWDWLLPQ